MADKLMVVIPCYNEEEVLPETSRRLVEKMAELTRKGLISPESRVLLVDDGSRDRTCLRGSSSAATGATRTRCWPG